MKTLAALILMIAATLGGCNIIAPPDPGAGSDSVTVCLWIAADQDTYASYGRQGEEGDLNFGRHGMLGVATGPLGRKRAYVDFPRPIFPAGTNIYYAKLELYHPAKNGDGTTDDITLNGMTIRNEAWSPLTLTWNNRPDRQTAAMMEFPLYLRSQAWSGSGNIIYYARDMFTNPAGHFGFMISLSDEFFAKQIDKGFYSNNDIRRKQNDLGNAPRLLVKVKLPPGSTKNDIRLPAFLPPDHDLGHLPQPVTTLVSVASDDFPAEWNASPDR